MLRKLGSHRFALAHTGSRSHLLLSRCVGVFNFRYRRVETTPGNTTNEYADVFGGKIALRYIR